MEDPSLLQHVKDFLLKFSKPICSKQPSSAYKNHNGKEPMVAESDNDNVEALAMENIYALTDEKFDGKAVNGTQRKNNKEFSIDSLDVFSNGCEQFHQMENPLRLESVDGGSSRFQSLQFLDDDFSYGFQDSLNPSDCISEALVNQEKVLSSTRSKGANNLPLKELQNSNHTKSGSLDPKTDEDMHYKRTIFTILGSSTQLVGSPLLQNFSSRSSFRPWKKGIAEKHTLPVQQKMLKKILFTVPLLSAGSLNCLKDGKRSISKQGNEDMCTKNVMRDKLRENEKFMALKAMLPSLNEVFTAYYL